MPENAAPRITYRKTKTGEWVAFAPFSSVAHAEHITVTKKDGSTKVETIERFGKPFMVDGVEMVYCYLAPQAKTAPKPRLPPSPVAASPRQVDYLIRLIDNGAWHDSDAGQYGSAPSVREIENMSAADVSALIEDLKGAY